MPYRSFAYMKGINVHLCTPSVHPLVDLANESIERPLVGSALLVQELLKAAVLKSRSLLPVHSPI